MEKTRLDLYISDKEGLSRSYAAELIEKGNISVNGIVIKSKSYKVSDDDTVDAVIPEPTLCDIKAEDIPLEILFEDKDLLVVNKPKGMVVHPAAGNYSGTLVNALLWHCGSELSKINDSENDDIGYFTGIGGVIRPGIVHRIDKDTSGLLVVAKNDNAHIFLSEQLKKHKMGRFYECISVGIPKENKFTVNAPISRHPTDRKKMAIIPGGKEAITHGEVIESFYTSDGNYSHLRLQLETGRTHQIRVHLSSIGKPCLGDNIYGGDKNNFYKKNQSVLSGQCLHAKTLEFIHPSTGKLMHFDSELPEYFTVILEKLKRMSF